MHGRARKWGSPVPFSAGAFARDEPAPCKVQSTDWPGPLNPHSDLIPVLWLFSAPYTRPGCPEPRISAPDRRPTMW
jgi:hypothetical protein